MPHVGLFILALVDIAAGILLYFHPGFLPKLFLYFAIFCLAKGGWSILSAIVSKFYFEFLGLLDVAVGVFLFLLYNNISFPFFYVFGIMLVLKGIWSMFFAVTAN